MQNSKVIYSLKHKSRMLLCVLKSLCLVKPFCILCIILLSACSGQADFFKIEGRLRNISQGEFYLYSTSGAMTKIDTIIVQDGRFAHQTFIDKPATLMLVFPNFSEQPIFAQPGRTAKIKGDVTHLKELEITGTKANKQMTSFRQSIANVSPPEAANLAEQFVKDNPDSEVSMYLIEKYFIKTPDPEYSRAIALLKHIIDFNPNQVDAKRLRIQITKLSKTEVKKRVPIFSAQTTEGKNITQVFCRKKVGVILAWASWNYDSQSYLRQLRHFKEAHPDDVEVLTVSLDMSRQATLDIFKREDFYLPTICDQQVWDSKIVQDLAICQVPEMILIDKTGRIHSHHTDFYQMEQAAEKIL